MHISTSLVPQWKTLNNLLRKTTQSAIITKNVTHYSLTIETNRKKKCYFVLSTIWYCGVNYTCMIIMYKGYTHDSWGHFVNPSSQTHKLPPFVRGSLEWALSWPRFLNEKRVKEVLEVWKMTLHRVTGLAGFGVSNLSLNGTSFSFRCSGGIYRSIAPNASHVNTLFSPPCSENFGFDRICLANLSPFLYCLCS